MILSATASSPNVLARYDSLPPGYTPLKSHKNVFDEIEDEDLLPLLHSASKSILRKHQEQAEMEKKRTCWSKLTRHDFNLPSVSNNVQNIAREKTYIQVIDMFKAIAAIWLLFFRIAYYLSQTYDVTRKNTNHPTPSSIFKCLDTSLLIHADLAFDILLLISGFLISRPWYLYFVKMANNSGNRIFVIKCIKTYCKFLYNKFMRICPIYYVGLIIIISFNYIDNVLNDFSYCYDHMWRMITFSANQYYSQYCHNEFWFISLLIQLYIATPIMIFISFSIYLKLTTENHLERTWIARNVLIIVPIVIFIYLLNGKYNLNMNVNSEATILTSNYSVGDYSPIYRGGISYLVGVIVSILQINRKYVVNNEMQYDNELVNKINFNDSSGNNSDAIVRKFHCCSKKVIWPLFIILLVVLSGPGTYYTFGHWKNQVKIWYADREEKEIAVTKLLLFRTLFTISVGIIFKYCLEVEENYNNMRVNNATNSFESNMTMYAGNNNNGDDDTSNDELANEYLYDYDDDDYDIMMLEGIPKKSFYGKIITLNIWKTISRLSFIGFIFGHFIIVEVVSIFNDIEFIENNDTIRVYSILFASFILSSGFIMVLSAILYTYFEKPLLIQKRLQVFE